MTGIFGITGRPHQRRQPAHCNFGIGAGFDERFQARGYAETTDRRKARRCHGTYPRRLFHGLNHLGIVVQRTALQVVQRRASVAVPLRRAGAAIEQCQHRVSTHSAAEGQHQRRHPLPIGGVDVGAGVNQLHNRGALVVFRRGMTQGCPSLTIRGFHVGARINESPQNFGLVGKSSRIHQGGHACFINGGNVGTGIYEAADLLGGCGIPPSRGRRHQRRNAAGRLNGRNVSALQSQTHFRQRAVTAQTHKLALRHGAGCSHGHQDANRPRRENSVFHLSTSDAP